MATIIKMAKLISQRVTTLTVIAQMAMLETTKTLQGNVRDTRLDGAEKLQEWLIH